MAGKQTRLVSFVLAIILFSYYLPAGVRAPAFDVHCGAWFLLFSANQKHGHTGVNSGDTRLENTFFVKNRSFGTNRSFSHHFHVECSFLLVVDETFVSPENILLSNAPVVVTYYVGQTGGFVDIDTMCTIRVWRETPQ